MGDGWGEWARQRAIERARDRASEGSNERSSERSSYRASDRALERSGERSSERPTNERPINRSTERSSNRAIERAIGRPSDRAFKSSWSDRAPEVHLTWWPSVVQHFSKLVVITHKIESRKERVNWSRTRHIFWKLWNIFLHNCLKQIEEIKIICIVYRELTLHLYIDFNREIIGEKSRNLSMYNNISMIWKQSSTDFLPLFKYNASIPTFPFFRFKPLQCRLPAGDFNPTDFYPREAPVTSKPT